MFGLAAGLTRRHFPGADGGTTMFTSSHGASISSSVALPPAFGQPCSGLPLARSNKACSGRLGPIFCPLAGMYGDTRSCASMRGTFTTSAQPVPSSRAPSTPESSSAAASRRRENSFGSSQGGHLASCACTAAATGGGHEVPLLPRKGCSTMAMQAPSKTQRTSLKIGRGVRCPPPLVTHASMGATIILTGKGLRPEGAVPPPALQAPLRQQLQSYRRRAAAMACSYGPSKRRCQVLPSP
mmetsp:Transcript_8065/g.23024  ORF Transcript_8065/g.23024 Transcript_8065/m.23024 type:complete len:240 (+) Transcript_8065:1342-2061(+)